MNDEMLLGLNSVVIFLQIWVFFLSRFCYDYGILLHLSAYMDLYVPNGWNTDIQFLHKSTGRLPVPGCTNTHGLHVKMGQAHQLPCDVACDPKLRSVVRSSMHPCPRNWVAIGRMVVFYAQAANAFRVRIKCRHCMTPQNGAAFCPPPPPPPPLPRHPTLRLRPEPSDQYSPQWF